MLTERPCRCVLIRGILNEEYMYTPSDRRNKKYYIDDEDTPYMMKIMTGQEKVTLKDFKE